MYTTVLRRGVKKNKKNATIVLFVGKLQAHPRLRRRAVPDGLPAGHLLQRDAVLLPGSDVIAKAAEDDRGAIDTPAVDEAGKQRDQAQGVRQGF